MEYCRQCFKQLEDLNFSDDLAEISIFQRQLEKNKQLKFIAIKTGLKVNAAKTRTKN